MPDSLSIDEEWYKGDSLFDDFLSFKNHLLTDCGLPYLLAWQKTHHCSSFLPICLKPLTLSKFICCFVVQRADSDFQ